MLKPAVAVSSRGEARVGTVGNNVRLAVSIAVQAEAWRRLVQIDQHAGAFSGYPFERGPHQSLTITGQ